MSTIGTLKNRQFYCAYVFSFTLLYGRSTDSTAAARFSIYDRGGTLRGIAYLDHSLNNYSIVYPESEAYPIAELHRHRDGGGLDWWEVTVYDSKQIDERMIRIFASMICDIQESIDDYYSKLDS